MTNDDAPAAPLLLEAVLARQQRRVTVRPRVQRAPVGGGGVPLRVDLVSGRYRRTARRVAAGIPLHARGGVLAGLRAVRGAVHGPRPAEW